MGCLVHINGADDADVRWQAYGTPGIWGARAKWLRHLHAALYGAGLDNAQYLSKVVLDPGDVHLVKDEEVLTVGTVSQLPCTAGEDLPG